MDDPVILLSILELLFVGLALALTCLFVFSYAAHCFLTVVQDTAAGSDDVGWPDEPVLDWAWKFWYITWLLAFWLIPAWWLIKFGESRGNVRLPAWGFDSLIIGLLCLIFPLTLLSSMSATSKSVVFHPKLLYRMAGRPGVLGAFYLSSGIVLGGSAALMLLGLTSSLGLFIPLAAMGAAAGILIYGRLVGRLAWHFRESEPAKPKRKRRRNRPSGRTDAVLDPWSYPEDEPEERTEPIPAPKAEISSAKRVSPLVDEKPYELTDELKTTPAPASIHLPEGYQFDATPPSPKPTLPQPEQSRRNTGDNPESESTETEAEEPAPPAFPFMTGVYTFPWYRSTMFRWLWLCIGFVMIVMLYRFAASLAASTSLTGQ